MSKENESNDFKLEDLEKPLTEAESKEVIGGTVATPPASNLAPGLYVNVIDGMIVVSNKGGATNFSAGQFGLTPTPTQPPVVVPANPGITFTPPPAFNSSTNPTPPTKPIVNPKP
ncbi:hypothetical protein [Paenibacillus albus]|uniref:hypothetical protein n=1 Tax=Paenibacillus albus TaxID=2495582 RepID=UPI0015B276C4|nr:hypothetical protein [Paenibacillus albus]